MKKENRDRRYRELKAEGVPNLRRYSIRNQLLHPMYVEDWPGCLSEHDKACGNTIYKTQFAALYIVAYGERG